MAWQEPVRFEGILLSCAVWRSKAANPWLPVRWAAFVHSGQTVLAHAGKLDGGPRAADGLENNFQVDIVHPPKM
jgi:hypothetical protein